MSRDESLRARVQDWVGTFVIFSLGIGVLLMCGLVVAAVCGKIKTDDVVTVKVGPGERVIVEKVDAK